MSLISRVVQMTTYTGKDARDLTVKLLKAVATPRSTRRDLYTEIDYQASELLLSSKDNNTSIRIGDFGFALRVHAPRSLTSRVE
jgi:hypothetical protein